MHKSLEASVDALVGKLPAVAPVTTVEEEPPTVGEKAVPSDKLDAVRKGLEEVIQKLQETLNTLRE
jgi:hypothetical protein